MKRTPDAAAVTSLPRAPQDEAQSRVRHYIVTMGIRVVCFILMVTIQPYGWYTWVFGIAAAVLPYIAVVFANAGDDSVEVPVESPVQELTGARPAEPSAAKASDAVITIQETPAPSRVEHPGAETAS
ncbi:hypothetical protein GCM10025768_24090 [Microbacterium pseudoresistens]|uniref:DUF3099 domain-containing protein n=1 Tax=Microbacterium pseudoresistens TaxID=640634 RepID=A0A7Y9EWS3_9MICO|nr:hypothetical protein [Microbacterium pseudoresistens]